MTKKEVFQTFLKNYNMFIDFNGSDYTLFTKDNTIVTVANTPDELLQYIMGYNNCYGEMLEQISKLEQATEALHKQNNLNIENYENIILGMGGEQIEDVSTE